MKLTKITGLIWYNILLTAAALVVLYFFLHNLSHRQTDTNFEPTYAEFEAILEQANMPDTLKADISLSLYTAALSSDITATRSQFRDVLGAFPTFAAYIKVDSLFSAMYKVKQQVDVKQVETYFRVNEGEPPGVQNVIEAMNEERTGDYVGFVHLLVAMCLAGLLGGLLANMRGIFEFIRESKTHTFPEHLLTPYYLRPVTAVLSGVFVFFLANTLVATTTVNFDSQQIPFSTMISLLGIAILAGFASQEFMERLKAAASTLFGIQLPTKPGGQDPAAPQADNGNGDNQGGGDDDGNDDGKDDGDDDDKKPPKPTPPKPGMKKMPGFHGVVNRD